MRALFVGLIAWTALVGSVRAEDAGTPTQTPLSPFGALKTGRFNGAPLAVPDRFQVLAPPLLQDPEDPPESTGAVAVPPPAPSPAPKSEPAPSTVARIPPEDMQRLKDKARQSIDLGAIAAARTLLDNPAMRADPEALYILAETYDPGTLSKWGVSGIVGDPGRAAAYYGQASAEGYPGTHVQADNRSGRR